MQNYLVCVNFTLYSVVGRGTEEKIQNFFVIHVGLVPYIYYKNYNYRIDVDVLKDFFVTIKLYRN